MPLIELDVCTMFAFSSRHNISHSLKVLSCYFKIGAIVRDELTLIAFSSDESA